MACKVLIKGSVCMCMWVCIQCSMCVCVYIQSYVVHADMCVMQCVYEWGMCVYVVYMWCMCLRCVCGGLCVTQRYTYGSLDPRHNQVY